jgi:hypothetical protein
MNQKRSFIVTVEIKDDPSSPTDLSVIQERIEKSLDKEFKSKLLFVEVEDLEWGEPC